MTANVVETEHLVLKLEAEGVDATWRDHDFTMSREVVERAAGKPYGDVTLGELARMIDREAEPPGAHRRIGDLV
ncbi:MAG: DUF5800 family protein [Halobacteriota archaeon]